MAKKGIVKHVLRQFNVLERRQGRVLKHFYDKMGIVYFGRTSQHDDEYDAIRGFTSSLTHRDEHFGVGTYEDYDIRMVNRADSRKDERGKTTLQLWTILEVHLRVRNMPHIFFVPTGQ